MLTLPLHHLRNHLRMCRVLGTKRAAIRYPARFMHRPQHPKNQPKEPAQCTMFI